MIDEEQHMAAITLIRLAATTDHGVFVLDEKRLEFYGPRMVNGVPYIDATPTSVHLEGRFVPEILEAVAAWMRSPSMVYDYYRLETTNPSR